MKVAIIIPAAGQGRRFGGETLKQYHKINNRSILELTIIKVLAVSEIDYGLIAVAEKEIEYTFDILRTIDGFEQKFKIVVGGDERQDSVYNCIEKLPADTNIIVVHDGVRPLVSSQLISKSIQMAVEKGACITAIPVKDTIKKVNENTVVETIPRDNLWSIQTPQSFQYSILKKAHDRAKSENYYSTDEAALVEWINIPVSVIEGEYSNIKITTKQDLEIARKLYY